VIKLCAQWYKVLSKTFGVYRSAAFLMLSSALLRASCLNPRVSSSIARRHLRLDRYSQHEGLDQPNILVPHCAERQTLPNNLLPVERVIIRWLARVGDRVPLPSSRALRITRSSVEAIGDFELPGWKH